MPAAPICRGATVASLRRMCLVPLLGTGLTGAAALSPSLRASVATSVSMPYVPPPHHDGIFRGNTALLQRGGAVSKTLASEAAAVDVEANLNLSGWGEGPWRLAQQLGHGRDNLCADGKLLPELYLLSAPKSSTTSIALQLIYAGVWRAHDELNDKEFHFFDGMMDWNIGTNASMKKQRKEWLKWFPPCPRSIGTGDSPRRLLADFTPETMRLVPFPSEARRFGIYPPWHADYGSQAFLPVLSYFYGDLIGRVKFLVLLREPLSRMQSAWYHAESFNFTNLCADCRAKSFHHALQNHVERALANPPEYSDWLWSSMYGLQLTHWMEYFPARQFFVAPYKYFLDDKKDNICRQFSETINFAIDCDSHGTPALHEWQHAHPGLDEDTTEHTRKRFKSIMDTHKHLLISKLAKAHSEGATLAGYSGATASTRDLMEWLENGW